MRPILIVGRGLIGAGVAARLRHMGHPVVGVARSPRPEDDGPAIDLSTPEGRALLAASVRESAPRCVILVHGPSDVTWCEEAPRTAIAIHEGVAAELADVECPVVLVSTDNVFDGAHALNRTVDPVAPVNAYGRAKLAAERCLPGTGADGPKRVVLRVSLVYGWSTGVHRRNFAEVCLLSATAGRPIEVPGDQYFTPVCLDDVVRVLASVALAPEKAPALAHVAGPEHLSRAAFARIAYETAGARLDLVREVPRADTTWASRPENSSLALSDLSAVPGLEGHRPCSPAQGLAAMWEGRRDRHGGPGRTRTVRSGRTLFGVDAGGSRTRVLVGGVDGVGHAIVRGSMNPAAVGPDLAAENLHDVLCLVRDAAEGREVRGWLASAAVSPETVGEQFRTISTAAARVGLRGTVTISNDTVPLLLAGPLHGEGCVVVVGTGSAFLAGDGQGRMTRAGGYEYLVSDEASAFDLGFAALRAAGRAWDGRGRPTGLVEALEARLGAELPTAARRLAALAYPKHAVAALAPVVCRTWLEGDPVAASIVIDAIDQLASFTALVRRNAPCSPTAGTVITGGVAAGCAPFADALHKALLETCGDHPVRVRPDAAAAALELAGSPHALEGSGSRQGDVHWTIPLNASITSGEDHEHH